MRAVLRALLVAAPLVPAVAMVPVALVLGVAPGAACPGDMLLARGVCIDRYEASMVDRATGEPLSPYYPPDPRLLREVFSTWEVLRTESGSAFARDLPLPAISTWQRTHDFEPKAVSAPGRVPQGYVSYYVAKRACENAGKRLCTSAEWTTACRGLGQGRFPYGNRFEAGACNVSRFTHPGHELHGLASMHQLDPRYNLLQQAGRPLLFDTGALPRCTSAWGDAAAFDMVGNLDEWVAPGEFRGGFYARPTRRGCDARVASHGRAYFDYSTGVRCCRDPE